MRARVQLAARLVLIQSTAGGISTSLQLEDDGTKKNVVDVEEARVYQHVHWMVKTEILVKALWRLAGTHRNWGRRYDPAAGAAEPYSGNHPLISYRRRIVFCALAMALFATPFYAQKGGSSGSGGGTSRPTTGGGPVVGGASPQPIYPNPVGQPSWTRQPLDYPQPMKTPPIVDEKCLPWNVSEVRATTVSVAQLQIPSKASHEYDKACELNNKQSFAEAEQHVRSAIDKFQSYAAAWTLLGVILEEEQKRKEAEDACHHAMSVDTTFLPGYLCKSELAARDQDWDQVLNLSKVAQGLNSMGDGYVYYYRAAAYFHLNDLADAKKNALQSAEMDITRNEVPLDLLMAQIYDAEGDARDATDRLKAILKRHASGPEEDAAKKLLAKIESQTQDAK